MPEDLPDVVPADLPLTDFGVLALVVDDFEVEPADLLLFEVDPPVVEPEDEVRPLLLPIDDVFDEDDDGLLDDPLDRFDDWFELWFFSVSFIVLISLFIVKN